MKPYYTDEAVTIYHGDCRELISGLAFDAVVTDPPYGIGYIPAAGGTAPFGKAVILTPEQRAAGFSRSGKNFVGVDVTGDAEPFDPAFLLACGKPTMLWGGNHYADRLPASSAWLVWDKKEGGGSSDFADCELAWSNLGGPARLFHHRWSGLLRASRDLRLHPTQKPEALMRWCLRHPHLSKAALICDPYMGSGTTLRAAKDLGRRAIGIEIEERYCEVAAKRLGQEVLFGEPDLIPAPGGSPWRPKAEGQTSLGLITPGES